MTIMTIEFEKPSSFRQSTIQRPEEIDEGWIPTRDSHPPGKTFGYVFNSDCRDPETGIPVVFAVEFFVLVMNRGEILEPLPVARIVGANDWKPLSHYSFWQPRHGSPTPRVFKGMP
jgi:hypothetical protein